RPREGQLGDLRLANGYGRLRVAQQLFEVRLTVRMFVERGARPEFGVDALRGKTRAARVRAVVDAQALFARGREVPIEALDGVRLERRAAQPAQPHHVGHTAGIM